MSAIELKKLTTQEKLDLLHQAPIVPEENPPEVTLKAIQSSSTVSSTKTFRAKEVEEREQVEKVKKVSSSHEPLQGVLNLHYDLRIVNAVEKNNQDEFIAILNEHPESMDDMVWQMLISNHLVDFIEAACHQSKKNREDFDAALFKQMHNSSFYRPSKASLDPRLFVTQLIKRKMITANKFILGLFTEVYHAKDEKSCYTWIYNDKCLLGELNRQGILTKEEMLEIIPKHWFQKRYHKILKIKIETHESRLIRDKFNLSDQEYDDIREKKLAGTPLSSSQSSNITACVQERESFLTNGIQMMIAIENDDLETFKNLCIQFSASLDYVNTRNNSIIYTLIAKQKSDFIIIACEQREDLKQIVLEKVGGFYSAQSISEWIGKWIGDLILKLIQANILDPKQLIKILFTKSLDHEWLRQPRWDRNPNFERDGNWPHIKDVINKIRKYDILTKQQMLEEIPVKWFTFQRFEKKLRKLGALYDTSKLIQEMFDLSDEEYDQVRNQRLQAL